MVFFPTGSSGDATTTTVAQADSSVGGKTGVDSSLSKNAFGAFWQPAAVTRSSFGI